MNDDEEVNFHDLDFDFDAYFKAYFENSNKSAKDGEDFTLRVMGVFCKDFYRSGGDPSKLKPWVVNYLADAFFQVMGGVPWNRILPTPFDSYQSDYSTIGDRALSIYCEVENKHRSDPTTNITFLIAAAAKSRKKSYETARADYYAVREWVENKTPPPKNFLKMDNDI